MFMPINYKSFNADFTETTHLFWDSSRIEFTVALMGHKHGRVKTFKISMRFGAPMKTEL